MQTEHTGRPRFSIVIPTFNTDGVLNHCLESLCNQYVDKNIFEVIVVNDGGRTEVSRHLDSMENHIDIRYFSQNHKGPAAARNLGIEKAKGDIILFLDDDSMPARDWLSATITAWEESPDFDGIGGYILSEPTDNMYCRVNADFFNWYLDQHSLDGDCTFLLTCNAGYRKAILNRIDKFDESFKKAAGEDRDLNIKISRIGGRLRLDKEVLVYHDRDLTFRSFVKKNYNYGKAAYNIYTRYPDMERLSSTSYMDYYISILGKYRTVKEKMMVFSLLTLSQVCTITGYYTALFLRQK